MGWEGLGWGVKEEIYIPIFVRLGERKLNKLDFFSAGNVRGYFY